jgi:hypothetical protein
MTYTKTYVECLGCGNRHGQISHENLLKLVNEFQEGNGQVVTGKGIRSRCLLDVLERPVRENSTARRTRNGEPLLSPL